MKKKIGFICFEGMSGSGKTTLVKSLCSFFEKQNIPYSVSSEPTKKPTKRNFFGFAIRKLIEGSSLTKAEIKKFKSSVIFFIEHQKTNGGLTERKKQFNVKLNSIVGKLSFGTGLTEFDRQIIFIADRYFHSIEFISPTKKNNIVLEDRYDLSTAAHYSAVTNSDANFLGMWQYPVLNGVYEKPDIIFYLRVSAEEALSRQIATGKVLDRYEGNLGKIRKLANAYEDSLIQFKNAKEGDPRHRSNIVCIDASKSAERVFREVKNFLTSYYDF